MIFETKWNMNEYIDGVARTLVAVNAFMKKQAHAAHLRRT